MAQEMLSFFDQNYLTESQDQQNLFGDEETNISDFEENKLEEEKNVITINQTSLRQPKSKSMLEALEYRLKVQASSSSTLLPGETRKFLTNIEIGKKPVKLSLLLKSAEMAGVRFLSEGYINPTWKGRVSVTLQNANCANAIIPAGTVVAFLILSPFVQ